MIHSKLCFGVQSSKKIVLRKDRSSWYSGDLNCQGGSVEYIVSIIKECGDPRQLKYINKLEPKLLLACDKPIPFPIFVTLTGKGAPAKSLMGSRTTSICS
jgi:hypothetical protein